MPIRPVDPLPHQMTEEQYRRLPEEVARGIEVVHGHVIVCESPTPEHNRIARRLANALDKKVQYARVGIPLYLVVVLDEKYGIDEILEFRLDAHAGEYRLHRGGTLRLEHVVLGDITVPDLSR